MVWVSTETRVVWGHMETGVVWTSTWAVWISVWISTETKAVWISVWVSTENKAVWISAYSAWSPGYGGKVGGQEGAEGFMLKSIPLGHKSGIIRREKKGNTYTTSTHFPCSLQNRSNCKTVVYLRDPQPATVCRPPMDTVAMQYHIGRPGVSSLNLGDQIYPISSGYSSKEWGWNC